MITDPLNRAAFVLGVGAAATSVFAFIDPIQYRLVRLHGPGLATLLALAVLAIAGALLNRRGLVAVAGAGFLAAAGLQLVQLGGATNWLRGDGSTFSLFLGVGVGLLVLGLVRAPATGRHTPDPIRRD